MSYAQYFNFGTGPELVSKRIKVPTRHSVGTTYRGYDTIVQTVRDGMRDEGASARFDKIMAGHDKTTKGYTNTLKSIYDGYTQYAKDYEGELQPIIEALTGDIDNMEGYIGDYNDLLAENKDTFLNGIVLDPNANRTRSEYTNQVAEQYNAAEDSLRRDSISQGINPYQNKGAARDLKLSKAKDIGLASGRAYTDWREAYNRDKQAQQQATAQFMGLQGDALEGQGAVMQARAGLGQMHGSVLESKTAADRERAKGYEGLTSLSEARRQEALGLGQQQQENQRQNADIKQQLSAKISRRDKRLNSLYRHR